MPPSLIAPPVARAVAELEHHFEIERSLEDGANGYVFVGHNRVSGQAVVIKFYAGEPGHRLHSEPRLLSSVDSPHVLPILDARVVENDWAYFVTPLCRQGNLDNAITSGISAQQALDLAIGVCAGASAIHSVGLVHRDLKPANIVCEAGIPLIADFGSVRQMNEYGIATAKSGHAVLYRPPESVPDGQYTVQGDIYQVGVVTYQLLGGALSYDPIGHLSRQELSSYRLITDEVEQTLFIDSAIVNRARTGRLIRLSTLPPWVSRQARDCIRRMTSPDPSTRYVRVSDVVADLQRARATQPDWRATADGALLNGSRTVAVSAIGSAYEARFQDNGRRVRGTVAGSLAEVVRSVQRRSGVGVAARAS